MAENTDSEKHQALRQILTALNLPVDPSYFSEGSTVTKDALWAIRDGLAERERMVRVHCAEIASARGSILKLFHHA
jgi:hypothetical protein